MSFLPGMMGILTPDPSTLPLTSLVYSDHTYAITSAPVSATIPADVEAGDLIVIAVSPSRATTPPPAHAITGFTDWLAATYVESGLGVRYQVAYKIADGTEGGTSVTVSSFAAPVYAIVFKPNRPLTAVGPVDDGFNSTSGNPAAVTITASTSTDKPTFSFAFYGAQGLTFIPTPLDMSPSQDAEIGDSNTFKLAWRFALASGGDVVVDIGDNGIHNTVGGGYMTLN